MSDILAQRAISVLEVDVYFDIYLCYGGRSRGHGDFTRSLLHANPVELFDVGCCMQTPLKCSMFDDVACMHAAEKRGVFSLGAALGQCCAASTSIDPARSSPNRFQTVRKRTRCSFRDMVATCCAKEPVSIVLEDLLKICKWVIAHRPSPP